MGETPVDDGTALQRQSHMTEESKSRVPAMKENTWASLAQEEDLDENERLTPGDPTEELPPLHRMRKAVAPKIRLEDEDRFDTPPEDLHSICVTPVGERHLDTATTATAASTPGPTVPKHFLSQDQLLFPQTSASASSLYRSLDESAFRHLVKTKSTHSLAPKEPGLSGTMSASQASIISKGKLKTKRIQISEGRWETIIDPHSLLTFGERSVTALISWIRKVSRMWFTHVFLLLVFIAYLSAGAFIFQSVEHGHEQASQQAVLANREELKDLLWNATRHSVDDDEAQIEIEWRKLFDELMYNYEDQLYGKFSTGIEIHTQKWTFFSAMFYAGTTVSTIANTN